MKTSTTPFYEHIRNMIGEVPDEIRGFDWEEVFKYGSHPTAVIKDDVSTNGFGISDVYYVVAKYDGCNDEENWVAVVALWDGRFASISAGCDYTGWG